MKEREREHVSGTVIRDLPAGERPYEKCEHDGPGALSNAELLAVILRTGSRGESSTALAGRILRSTSPQGILGLLHLTMPELMEIRGVGRVKAVELLCVCELSKRIWHSLAAAQVREFTSPEQIAGFYMEEMRHLEQEELHVLMLNNKNALIRDVSLFRGTVNLSVASPREVFLEALRNRAVGIALIHNHPSGDPMPSDADREFTRRIREAGEMIGIRLIDHLIIGDQNYFSFSEWGILQ
jgi:DNA repair protein RadC